MTQFTLIVDSFDLAQVTYEWVGLNTQEAAVHRWPINLPSELETLNQC